jgi:preprotein translocase subunit SecF
MNILKYTKFFMLFSLILIFLGLGIIFSFGFKTSIEYTGGSVIKLKNFDNYETKIKDLASNSNIGVRELYLKDEIIVLKTSETSNEKVSEITTKLKELEKSTEILGVEVVGASVGIEFAKNSFLAFVISMLGIILYIAYSFKNISEKISSWYFGIAAIIAIFHDVLAVTSFFSLAGYFYNVEVDALFLTSLLTIAGFSINDTVVVFDRIRENLVKYEKSKTIVQIFNLSIYETLNRSIITSFTVIIIMFSLFLFGAGSIKYFSLALVIGIAFGTYSSIFIASPIVLFLKKVKK